MAEIHSYGFVSELLLSCTAGVLRGCRIKSIPSKFISCTNIILNVHELCIATIELEGHVDSLYLSLRLNIVAVH